MSRMESCVSHDGSDDRPGPSAGQQALMLHSRSVSINNIAPRILMSLLCTIAINVYHHLCRRGRAFTLHQIRELDNSHVQSTVIKSGTCNHNNVRYVSRSTIIYLAHALPCDPLWVTCMQLAHVLPTIPCIHQQHGKSILGSHNPDTACISCKVLE